MDDATKVSIEALKRIRDEAKAGKNPRKPKPKPKPERVTRGEGAVLLEDVRHFLLRFVIYPSEHAAIAHVLWIAHAHLMGAWESTPRLAFLSPEPASGKTRSMEVSELLVPDPVAAVNVTPAYLFRKVGGEDGPPTILFDEIDTVFGAKAKEHEELRALLNSGHQARCCCWSLCRPRRDRRDGGDLIVFGCCAGRAWLAAGYDPVALDHRAHAPARAR